jgi:uncharacterized protein (DUF983 family)
MNGWSGAMFGTTCPHCGEYFGNDFRAEAAEHLMTHSGGEEIRRISYFDHHRQLSLTIFGAGIVTLAMSLFSI